MLGVALSIAEGKDIWLSIAEWKDIWLEQWYVIKLIYI